MSCTIGVRTVLQLLVVALIHNPEYERNGCFGKNFECSKRVSYVYPCKVWKFDSESSISRGD
jgi:hypothetical protein